MIRAPDTSGNTAREIKELNMKNIYNQLGNPPVKKQTQN